MALAWRLINEPFLRDQNTLSDLKKLRAGYGVTGQQDIIDDYPWMTTYSISYPESSYLFDEWYHTYRPNGYDNDIKWETTTTWNVGVDWGFINNRINGSVDYYKRFTKDLLNTINVPAGVNYAPVLTTNIGSMENQGVEIAVNAIPVTTRDWEWTIGFNYTWQQSKITKLNVIDSENNFVNTGAISGTGKDRPGVHGRQDSLHLLSRQAGLRRQRQAYRGNVCTASTEASRAPRPNTPATRAPFPPRCSASTPV